MTSLLVFATIRGAHLRFDAPLDACDLRKLADEIRSELRSLDLGGIAALSE
jgi:hypothetical protein